MLDPKKTKLLKQLKHTSPLIGCRFDPSGGAVFASAQDNTIQRWDLESGKKTTFSGHGSWVRGLAFHVASRSLLSGGYEGRLIWWPADDEKPAPTRVVEKAHNGWIRAVAVSPDGSLVATCGNDNLVKLWSVTDGKLVRELEGHQCHVYNVAFHPGGEFLVSGDLKGVLKVWEISTGKSERGFDAKILYKYDGGFRADIGGIRSMAFNADGSRLACGGITNVSNAFAGVGNPLVVVFDWEKGEKKDEHYAKDKFRGVAWGVAFHPQGFRVGVSGGGSGGFLLFWNPGEKHEFFKLKLPNTGRDLDLHPDKTRLATAHYDGHVRVYAIGKAEKKEPAAKKEDAKKKS